MSDPLAAWPVFSDAVRARLEAGRTTYGFRSFARPMTELAEEIEQELLDTAAWAFIAYVRHRRLRGLAAWERNRCTPEDLELARQSLDDPAVRAALERLEPGRYEPDSEDGH